MTTKKSAPWTFVSGDRNWQDYGGLWAQKVGPGQYDFLEWYPSDSGKGGEATETTIDLANMKHEIPKALATVGLRIVKGRLVTSGGDLVPIRQQSLAIAEALHALWGASWSGASRQSTPGLAPTRALGKTLYAQLVRAHARAHGISRRRR